MFSKRCCFHVKFLKVRSQQNNEFRGKNMLLKLSETKVYVKRQLKNNLFVNLNNVNEVKAIDKIKHIKDNIH